jgi:AGCS family alanine or glycine:cation symporter
MQGIESEILSFLEGVSAFLWGWPLLLPLVITGLLYTISLKGIQFTGLKKALQLSFFSKKSDDTDGDGDISHFQALMTALSATVGTGNIAGVATAVTLGGPGAIFWMWLTGFVGMATKYAEATLGVHYREKHANGEYSGGPMYYIIHGLSKKWHFLAYAFAFFLFIAALGIGNMVQSNSIADVMQSTFNIPNWITGLTIASVTALVVLGGIKRIADLASKIVPTMIVVYLMAGTTILVLNADMIDDVLALIFNDAFDSIDALLGGVIGDVVSKGVGRGVFSNEAGLGSAPIIAAAARTDHPVSQALVSMTQTFIDTIVVCTFTGLIIVMSGLALDLNIGGAALTGAAFSKGLGYMMFMGYEVGELIIVITLMFFVFSTIIGWYYYGEKGFAFLFGDSKVVIYKITFLIVSFLGAIITLKLAWTIAEVFTALMILPNIIALILLNGKVRSLTQDYFKNHATKKYKLKPFHNDISN